MKNVEQLVRLAPDALFLGLEPVPAPEGMRNAMPQVHVERGADVVRDRHGPEQPDVLERSRDAALGDEVRLFPSHGPALEKDEAARGPVNTGDEVEDGCLARAVGADEARQFAALDAKIESGDGLEASEPDGDVAQLEERFGFAHAFFRFREMPPNSPAGG